ncbi:MAG: phosphate acyltransferase PlsX [Armatimonadetes bacterium]|nr:phosphate acyltransferase PlsX [Armatimonadota bacterium]
MKIAVDGMGGDYAPEPVVHGVLNVASQIRGEIILVGDIERMKTFIPASGLPKNVTLRHASQVVGMDEKPTTALRTKKDSSISVCAQMVKAGEAQAFVSAGNTGACSAAALLSWRQIGGVHRPAIAQVFPNKHGRFLLLDAGASPDVDPEHLVEFALMGRSFAEKVMGRKNPKIHLLNIGEEPGKGNQFAKSAYDLMSQHAWFAGNIESKDVFRKEVDVVVCDAFTGNIMLKACEGVAEFIMDEIRGAVPGWPTKALFLPMRTAMRPVKAKIDYAEYGGSPLLGVNGICVIGHGRSNARAIENAILNAARAVEADLVETIRAAIARDLPQSGKEPVSP